MNNKLKKYLLNLWYGLPFGMRAADIEIRSGSVDKDSNGTTVEQGVTDERVAKSLLRGEVTNEVGELRYRTYRVDNESKKYKYLGNGVAVSNDQGSESVGRRKFRFSQDNENICESVLETLKQVGSYGVEKYRFEIDYNSTVRFKVEKFATSVDVYVNEDEGIVETTLHFNKEPNPYDATSKPFINEVSKLLNVSSEYEIKRNEIASSIMSLSFSTYKAVNEDDLVSYSFIGGGKFKSFGENAHEYLMTLEWDEYIRLPLNLESKYFSKTMADKYARNEKKNVVVDIGNLERKRYCKICGSEMSVYDADIQEASGHMPICSNCMKSLEIKSE